LRNLTYRPRDAPADDSGDRIFEQQDVAYTVGDRNWNIFYEGVIKPEIEEFASDPEISERLQTIDSEVVMIAIGVDELLWTKSFKVVEGGIVEDVDDEPTLWVRVSPEAAESLAAKYLSNASKAELKQDLAKHWLSGGIKVYPVKKGVQTYEKLSR